MPTTTVTTTRTSNVAVHTISFRGLAGAIFCTVAIACLLYVIGFATTAWSITKYYRSGGGYNIGLWQTCSCGKAAIGNHDSWFHAVQAMITIGLICLLIAFLLICIYMCIHSVSKNSTILALVIFLFVGVLFMLIGFLIYGIKGNRDLSWSYAVTVIAGILTFVAGVLAVFQMRESGVRV